MTTGHFNVVSALVDWLKRAPSIAGGNVFRSRSRAFSRDTAAAIVVRPVRSASQLARVIGGPTIWQTLLHVECYARGTGDAQEEAVDALIEAVFACIAADPSLGGQIVEIVPLEGDTLSWDFDELDTTLGCVTAQFVITHETQGRGLTQ
jgi:hypothetical protein